MPTCPGPPPPEFKLTSGLADESIRVCRSKVQVLCALVNLLWLTKWKRVAGGVKCISVGCVWLQPSGKCHSFLNKAHEVLKLRAAIFCCLSESPTATTRASFCSRLEITDEGKHRSRCRRPGPLYLKGLRQFSDISLDKIGSRWKLAHLFFRKIN